MQPRLFHFSESDSIDCFLPRPVVVPSPRPDGQDWLNGPLVWAIDEWHQPMYLFPRECPRILLWRTEGTTAADVERYFGASSARMLAFVQTDWLQRIQSASVYRYELPTGSFECLEDAGMWVSREPVVPVEKLAITNIPARLRAEDVELRSLEVLLPLRNVWDTTLHASGIRLRNARNWHS